MNRAYPDCTSCVYYRREPNEVLAGAAARASSVGTCARIVGIEDADDGQPAWLIGRTSDDWKLRLRVTSNFHCSEHTPGNEGNEEHGSKKQQPKKRRRQKAAVG